MKENKTGLGVTGNTWGRCPCNACHPDLSNIGTKIQRCVILTTGQRGVQGEDVAVSGSEWDLGCWSQPVLLDTALWHSMETDCAYSPFGAPKSAPPPCPPK